MLSIREALPTDCQAIHQLIMELAIYEKAPEKMVNTPENLLKDGFGPSPLYTCFVAEFDGAIVGISFCYTRYSTWIGKVLYLEDLIVTESHRRKGIGKQLFDYTRQYAKQNNFVRMSWQVLDWNTPAIEFYKQWQVGLDAEWLNAWIDIN